MPACFVTGTDTGVGKSVVTAALLRTGAARGLATVGIKPLAAGATPVDGKAVNEDAVLLMRHASRALAYDAVNPVLLARAMAPHLAAAAEGRSLVAAELVAHCRAAARVPHDLLLAEGAGGWLVPLNARETMADVARALGWPVILVVGMRLGCLNHALLTAAAIRSAGLALAGWVANDAWPAMEAAQANVATLEARLDAPRLGTVPWLGATADVERAAACLDVSPLLK